MTTNSRSFVICTSISRKSTPSCRALWKEAKVFSGQYPAAPLWPIFMGEQDSEAFLIFMPFRDDDNWIRLQMAAVNFNKIYPHRLLVTMVRKTEQIVNWVAAYVLTVKLLDKYRLS